jgi:hypothetical protein
VSATTAATIGTMMPGEHHDLALSVHYDAGAAAGTPAAGEVDVVVTATSGCSPMLTQKIPLRLDIDDTVDGERDDHFDTAQSAWTASSTSVWQHAWTSPLDGAWHGADAAHAATESLVSPPLDVAGDRDFTVTFAHAYAFEFSDGTAWDAGVIEFSVDDGKTWADVATLVDPGYGTDKVTDTSGNSLAGRVGYTGRNPAYPARDTVTLAFGRQLAGQTVRLRFLIATDQAAGDAGWDVDDVSVSGITNAPFGAARPSTGTCEASGAEATDDGGCCDAGTDRSVPFASTMLALLYMIYRCGSGRRSSSAR